MNDQEKAEFDTIIFNLQKSRTPIYLQELVDRLEYLREAVVEEDETEHVETPFLPESLTALIIFVKKHPLTKFPTITIGPRGYFTITWRKSNEESLTIEFRNKDEVNFVLSVPKPKRCLRMYGLSTAEDMWKTATVHGALEWCMRK